MVQGVLRPGTWGMAGKAGAPSPHHAFLGKQVLNHSLDDLLLVLGLLRSRAAPSLQPIESQPLTQGFVVNE